MAYGRYYRGPVTACACCLTRGAEVPSCARLIASFGASPTHNNAPNHQHAKPARAAVSGRVRRL